MIFVWSVHHTATWTTLKWMESHADIGGVIELRFLAKVLLDGSYRYMTTQVWGGEKTVFHNHFVNHANVFDLDQVSLALALTSRTVVPLRDPLLSCLSAQRRVEVRGQGFGSLDACREWELAARVFPMLESYSIVPTEFIPWDLAPGPEHRYRWLQTFRSRLGFKDKAATDRWASRWPFENTEGDFDYLQAYIQRDVNWLKKKLPKMWVKLREMEGGLRPHLEKVGYENLIWWSG